MFWKLDLLKIENLDFWPFDIGSFKIGPFVFIVLMFRIVSNFTEWTGSNSSPY